MRIERLSEGLFAVGTSGREMRGALAAAGVDADGEQGTTGTLTVTAATLSAGLVRLVAGESLQVTAGTIGLTRDTHTETCCRSATWCVETPA